MMKCIAIISIDSISYDYNILSSYLKNILNVNKLCIIPQGFFTELVFEDINERRTFFSTILNLDVMDITICDILYEEFIRCDFRRDMRNDNYGRPCQI